MRSTASKVGLLPECAYWAQPGVEWATTTGDAADLGNRFHAAIAEYVEHGRVNADVADDIEAMLVSAIRWVEHFGREKLSAEVAFAWDPVADTAEVLGHNIGRDYAFAQAKGYLCGSADIVAVSRFTKTGYVGDWSTGGGSRKGPQLRALALMLARAEGLDSVTVEALEVSAEGVRHVCTETLDAFALAAVAGELAEALAAVPTATPQPGTHCAEGYCPARATCPAIVERVEQILPASALVQHRWGLTIESGDHAAWLYAQAKAVESAAKLVKDAVKAYVPEGGIALADGSVMAEGTRNMPRFDVERLKSLARSAGVTDADIEGCTRTVVESAGLKVKKPEAPAKPRSRKRAA